jgi:glycosyltransferase involved in cell wall biosynthesis
MAKRILLLADINSSHTQKWAIGLAEIGFQITIFSLTSPTVDWFSKHKIQSVHDSSQSTNVNYAGTDLSKMGYLAHLRKLKQVIKELKPDYVHAHYATSYGMLGMLSRFKPFYISVWGSDILEFPQKSFLHKMLMRIILNSANHIFATSKLLLEKTKALSSKPIAMIPFGVDTDVFQPSNQLKKNNLIIGVVKSMEAVYGIDILLRAFALLIQEQSELNVRLVLVGGGTKFDELKNLSKELAIDSVVEFTGKIKFEELPAVFGQFDVFANLSRSESFGVSVLEAMSSGLPVIVTATGGLLEIVTEETGIFVPVDDIQATKKALLELISNEEQRKTMGMAGRSRVIKEYNWKDSLKKMSYYYDR